MFAISNLNKNSSVTSGTLWGQMKLNDSLLSLRRHYIFVLRKAWQWRESDVGVMRAAAARHALSTLEPGFRQDTD